MSSAFPPPVVAQVRILVLCAHNRTRSVMITGLLRKYLAVDPRFVVESAGFGPEGLPALPEAVQMLAEQGIYMGEHRSRLATAQMVRDAHLILTADKRQVLSATADLGGEFDKTYTLPEYVHRLHHTMEERPRGFAYVASSVAEVEDPTGRMPSVWKSVFIGIDGWCQQVATSLVGQTQA